MTISWRDHILKEFAPQVALLTIVTDPDGLLLEEGILQGIRERGYELLSFDDHVAFRYVYESKFRSHWDRGELSDLSVVVRTEERDLSSLPYDLLQAGRKLSFNLAGIFPNFSYPVLVALDRSYLDELYKAQQNQKPEVLGDNATKEFILRHIFGIAPELIKQPSDLLIVLLRRHFRNERVPLTVDERFIQILRQRNMFKDWPLDNIVPDRSSFFAFLQERWPIFLDLRSGSDIKVVCESKAAYGLEYAGPVNIPFEHDDVRVYIDDLFFEGLLQPVSHEKADGLSKTWVSVGIKTDLESHRKRRLEGIIASVESTMPSLNAKYQGWLTFAYRWAELVFLVWEETGKPSSDIFAKFQALQERLDEAFIAWCKQHYSGLYNQPPSPPVMVHHVPKALARQMDETHQSKIAMIVVDGLALDQWLVMRDEFRNQSPELHFREGGVYAWIPTITSVSRQALFSGKMPLYFPNGAHITTRDSSLWIQFWIDRGLRESEIVYLKIHGDVRIDNIQEQISNPSVRIAGLVIDKVDKIMHGMELGTAGMHNQVRQWASQGYMMSLIEMLYELNFRIWLTSDHGNVESKGMGSPSEGVVADVRGERVRIYPSEVLRSQMKLKFPDTIEWHPYGLPDDFFPLLASDRIAFVKEGDVVVGHGGISLEEVIVPLIEIGRKGT